MSTQHANLVNVEDRTFEAQVLKSDTPVIVDFWATWCPPCRAIAPVYEKLSAEYQDQLLFAKMDTDQNPQTSMNYQIQAIPTMIVFKNGNIIGRLVGPNPGSLKRDIDRILASSN